MIAYEILIFQLINNIKRQIPDFNKPWYAGDTRALGAFVRIETYFNSLTHQDPGCGYYPEPSKSVLIVHPDNIKARKVFGTRHGFIVCTGAHCLGGYIGDDESKSDCLRECTMMWDKNIGTIRKTVGKYPQESYATMVCAIQSESISLQHVT